MNFVTNFYKGKPLYGEFNPEIIAAFMDEINDLLSHSTQLLNTDGELQKHSQVRPLLLRILWDGWMCSTGILPNPCWRIFKRSNLPSKEKISPSESSSERQISFLVPMLIYKKIAP
ncbi:MAG: hypothetical protein IK081_06970 [Lachnospiraceae bacterium]|nr:hypothetical protein [Lachnospiraceae bacterium]